MPQPWIRSNTRMSLYLGCPMWGLKSWVGPFFPPKTKQAAFLSAYSRRLSTVEGNTTFYALPDIATLERWRDEAAPGFKFCLKVPQSISHMRKLIGAEATPMHLPTVWRDWANVAGHRFCSCRHRLARDSCPRLRAISNAGRVSFRWRSNRATPIFLARPKPNSSPC